MASSAAGSSRRLAPITRNLSQCFAQYRQDRHHQKGYGLVPSSEAGQGLLADASPSRGSDSGRNFERKELPPQWVDSSDDAAEDIKTIQKLLVQLTKAQQKRLMTVFRDDAGPDRDVEQLSNKITETIRHCEQSIHEVKTRDLKPDATDTEFRKNMQRKLAAQLSKVSKECREAQKAYLTEIRKQREAAGAAALEGPSGPAPSNAAGAGGLTAEQQMELENMEELAGRRSAEFCQIASSVNDLHVMFKELAVLVIDQGSILDRIDFNLEQMVEKGEKTNKHLLKAQKGKKSADDRANKCMLGLIAANCVLIIILIIKAKINNGMGNLLHIWQAFCFFVFLFVALVMVTRFRPQLLPKWFPTAWIRWLPWPQWLAPAAPQESAGDGGEPKTKWQRVQSAAANVAQAPQKLAQKGMANVAAAQAQRAMPAF